MLDSDLPLDEVLVSLDEATGRVEIETSEAPFLRDKSGKWSLDCVSPQDSFSNFADITGSKEANTFIKELLDSSIDMPDLSKKELLASL